MTPSPWRMIQESIIDGLPPGDCPHDLPQEVSAFKLECRCGAVWIWIQVGDDFSVGHWERRK